MIFHILWKWFRYQIVALTYLQFLLVQVEACSIHGSSISVENHNSVEVTLRCTISGGLPGKVLWYKDGVTLIPSGTSSSSFSVTPILGDQNNPYNSCNLKRYYSLLTYRGELAGTYISYAYKYDGSSILSTFNIKGSSPPTNMNLKQIADRKVSVTWTPPDTPQPAQYELHINSNNVVVTEETQYTTGSVAYGDTLTFIIKAKGLDSKEEFYLWSVGLGPRSITVACDVHNSSISIIRSDFRNARKGWVTFRAIVRGPPGHDFHWLTPHDEVISNNVIYHIGTTVVHHEEECFGNAFEFDLLIKKKRPGLYRLQFKLDNERIHYLSINLEGGDPPVNLTLSQLSNNRVKATWNASYPFLNYRVFINTDRAFGEGNTVLQPMYISQPLEQNKFHYFRIRGTTNHYWSDVLGPKGIFILGVNEPSVYVIRVSKTSILLNIIQYHGGLLPTQYKIKFSNITCPEDAAELLNKFRLAEISITQESTLITNLDQYCSYGLIVVAINVEMNSTSKSVYLSISTKGTESPWFHDNTAASGVIILLLCGIAIQIWVSAALCTVCGILSCCIHMNQRNTDQTSKQQHTHEGPRKMSHFDNTSSKFSRTSSILKKGSMFRSGTHSTRKKYIGSSESREGMSESSNIRSHKNSITNRGSYYERKEPPHKSSRHDAKSQTSSAFSGSSRNTRRWEDESQSESRNKSSYDEDRSPIYVNERYSDNDSYGRKNNIYERNSSRASSHSSGNMYKRHSYRDSRDANISDTESAISHQRTSSNENESGYDRETNY